MVHSFSVEADSRGTMPSSRIRNIRTKFNLQTNDHKSKDSSNSSNEKNLSHLKNQLWPDNEQNLLMHATFWDDNLKRLDFSNYPTSPTKDLIEPKDITIS